MKKFIFLTLPIYLLLNKTNIMNITTRDSKSFTSHLMELRKITLPTAAQVEIMAEIALNGSTEAKEQLIIWHLRMVISVAKKYKVKGLLLEDLVAEGNLSLVKAIDSYKLGNNYTTWARFIIQRDLLTYISRYAHTIKFTNGRKEKGEEPIKINSFDDIKPGYDDLYFEDMLPGSIEHEEAEDRRDYNDNLKEVLKNNISKLTVKQQLVIQLLFLDEVPMKDVIAQLNITSQAIYDIKIKALQNLNELMKKN